MKIAEILNPDSVLIDLRAVDKRAVLADLAGRAATPLGIDAAKATDALLERENLGSTGMGDGLAIPHARLEKVRRPFGVFARLDRRIDFDAVDGRPVDLVFLLLLPACQGECASRCARLCGPQTPSAGDGGRAAARRKRQSAVSNAR